MWACVEDALINGGGQMALQNLRRLEVASMSNPNKTYIVVEKEDHTWQCSCPVWIFRRKECKHIKREKAKLGVETERYD